MARLNMKCYIVLKELDTLKFVVSAIMFFFAAIMLYGRNTKSIDCVKFIEDCPDMVATLRAAVDDNLTFSDVKLESTVKYCRCLDSCMNYFMVYDDAKDSLEETNCFPAGWATGIPKVEKTDDRRLGTFDTSMRFMPKTDGYLGAVSRGSCSSCTEIKDNQRMIFIWLGIYSLVAACLLAVSGTCDYKGVRLHSAGCHFATIALDALAIFLIILAGLVAWAANVSGMLACSPLNWIGEVRLGANLQSDTNNEHQAAFYNFFIKIIEPLFTHMCESKSMYTVYWIVCLFGVIAMCAGMAILCCISCGCTLDGEDDDDGHPHDENAAKLRQFHDLRQFMD